MKERPIIMGAESVRAILEGRKTQTRRVIKPQPPNEKWFLAGYPFECDKSIKNTAHFTDMLYCFGEEHNFYAKLPYKTGDRLWVREAWAQCSDNGILYKADSMFIGCEKGDFAWDWKSPMFMPRCASRITLEITDIRVERVQDISEENAKAEGIKVLPLQDESDPSAWYQYAPGIFQARSATKSYELLWDSINAKRGYPFESNPWVWAVTFKVVQ